ncbi:MAG TPA: hypothetical protein VNU26_18070 [Mycobacteriales bacterium]|nr:hypothetical protein [Mycobacteriales bacterium]
MLGQLERPGRVVVADFEAGLGTVLRLSRDPGSPVRVDVVVVVVEATRSSIDVGRRAVEAVTAGGLGRVVVTGNRIDGADDAARVRQAFPGLQPVIVPHEPAVVAAERQGRAPLDAAPDSPGVRALVGLAERVLAGA